MNKIEAIERTQVQILTRLAGYWTKKKGLCMNPFYRHKKKAIKENIELARKIYPDVFKHFLNTWFEQHGNFDRFPLPDKRLGELIIK